jgi:exodeoxyribonuclease VII small subunit
MSKAQATEMTFEQAMERLDEIVSSMEGNRMPLEEMVSAYEEGSQLLKLCKGRLDHARHRVELITQRANSTEPELVPFDPQEEPAELANSSTGKAATGPSRTAPRRKPATTTDDDDIRLF